MRSLLVICCLALCACAEERPVAGEGDGTRLVVEVKRSRDGPVERRVVDQLPAGVTPADFEPVAPGTACAAVYGGPETARVEGTLDGRPLQATFDRTNACEIARWDRAAALLGPAANPRP